MKTSTTSGLSSYDASQAPDAADWLRCPPNDKLRLVVAFHAAQRLPSGRLKSHAALHVVVEERLARGDGPVARALARLQQQGMARHEAVHAVGEVLRDHAAGQRQLNEALEQLTA